MQHDGPRTVVRGPSCCVSRLPSSLAAVVPVERGVVARAVVRGVAVIVRGVTGVIAGVVAVLVAHCGVRVVAVIAGGGLLAVLRLRGRLRLVLTAGRGRGHG